MKVMTKHTTGTRKEWLAARLELLKAEKELTRRGDELARRRQELPWVRIDKAYRFETDQGSASLADLFRGRSQLLVYHFMFGPDYTAGCPACSAIADGFNGFATHLANHDVMLWAVSRAPLTKLQAYQRRMGWTFPWASSFGSDFNPDFNVFFTEEQQLEGGIEYNYRREPPVALAHESRRGRPGRRHDRHRRGHLRAGEARLERVGAPGRRRLSHLFRLCARAGRPLGRVPVARPRPQGAQRDRLLVAPPRRVRQALSRVAGRRMASDRASRQAFLGASLLLFAVSAAVTITWCISMSAMGEMPMPGGWTMSMAWMRMPGQTWAGPAASFLGMWVVMMVAMMLPSLVPVLERYRGAVARTGETRLGSLTALVGVGYFFVWTVLGMAAFPVGAALAAIEMQQPTLARSVPIAIGRGRPDRGLLPVHRVEGTSPCRLPGGTRTRPHAAGRPRHGLATRPAPRSPLQPLLCRPDGDSSSSWDHGPARDGSLGGGHHRRTSRTGRGTRCESHRGRRRRVRLVSDRAGNWARMTQPHIVSFDIEPPPRHVLDGKSTPCGDASEGGNQCRR